MLQYKFVIVNSESSAYEIFHGTAHAFLKFPIRSIDINRFSKSLILIEHMVGVCDHHEEEVRGLQGAKHIEATLFAS